MTQYQACPRYHVIKTNILTNFYEYLTENVACQSDQQRQTEQDWPLECMV